MLIDVQLLFGYKNILQVAEARHVATRANNFILSAYGFLYIV